MKKFIYLAMLTCFAVVSFAQAPQGFNYQAVIRNADGQPLATQAVSIRLTIQSDSNTQYYTETHNTTTSPQGIISVAVGSGSGSTGSLTNIPWASGGINLKVEVATTQGGTFSLLGTSPLLAVPFALYARSATEVTVPTNVGEDEPLFVVRNSAGQIVFAVYQTGVRMYVEDDGSKSTRGGFAVGGLSDQNKEGETEYLRVTPDSTRIYLRTNTEKTSRGGFAVGGLSDQNKLSTNNLMFIAPDSARIWVNSEAAKGTKGGFAVGAYNAKSEASNFILLTPENYFIGHNAGANTTDGLYNSFFGYESGFSNTTGNANVFMGRRTGYYNTSGFWNIFLGRNSGYSNTSGYANFFAGDFAGFNNTTGYYNVFLGDYSGGSNTEGNLNVFIGENAGWSNTTGNYNIFIGSRAGYKNIEGKSNVFTGSYSGYFNTSGEFNAYMGTLSGYYNTTGSQNVFIGQEAGYYNESGKWNAFLGTASGYNNTTGNANVAIGDRAGFSNSTGNANVFIGQKAGYHETGSNKLYIHNSDANENEALIWGDFELKHLRFNASFVGINATPSTSQVLIVEDTRPSDDNPAIFGKDVVTQNWGIGVVGRGGFMGVQAENPSTSGDYNFGFYTSLSGTASGTRYGIYSFASGATTNWAGYFSGNLYAESYYSSSDVKLKKDITPLESSLNKLLGLHGVRYQWKTDDELLSIIKREGDREEQINKFNFPTGYQIGLLAQDVEEQLPEVVLTDEEGFKYINYTKLIPLLIEGIKEQQSIIENVNFQSSDRRWKTNINRLNNSLKIITSLNGVSFEWKAKEFPDKKFQSGRQIGFIAQDAEPLVPEIVLTDEKGYKSIDYSKLAPHIVEAIKEQQDMINRQNKVIERLEKENSDLKKSFIELKAAVDKMLMDKTSKIEPPAKATTSYGD